MAQQSLNRACSFKCFGLDTTLLGGKANGIVYRCTKNLEDKKQGCLASNDVVFWGSTVDGVDTGDGWVKVGNRYLPKKLDGMDVMFEQVDATAVNSSENNGVVLETTFSSEHKQEELNRSTGSQAKTIEDSANDVSKNVANNRVEKNIAGSAVTAIENGTPGGTGGMDDVVSWGTGSTMDEVETSDRRVALVVQREDSNATTVDQSEVSGIAVLTVEKKRPKSWTIYESAKQISNHVANDPVKKKIAGSAARGAVVGGTTGGTVGATAGSMVGGAVGVFGAFFTLGLSIPLGAVVGGGIGLTTGVVAGGGAGLAAGGAIGYRISKKNGLSLTDN